MINNEVIVIRKLIPQLIGVSISISHTFVNFPSVMLLVMLHCVYSTIFLLHSYSVRVIYLSLYLNEYLYESVLLPSLNSTNCCGICVIVIPSYASVLSCRKF